MTVPAIGGAQGIFEMFVPGAFVVLNALFVLYSALGPGPQEQLRALASDSILSLIALICFGYLVGVILRLFRTEVLDGCSAWLLRLTARDARNPEDRLDWRNWRHWKRFWDQQTDPERKAFQSWAVEDFPYVEWIGKVHTFRTEAEGAAAVKEFHERVWPKRATSTDQRFQNKTFFNYCKTLINSVDPRAAAEVYVAEALNRYLTGMFYSLLIALVLMAAGLFIQRHQRPDGAGWLLFLLAFVAYFLMLFAIVRQFRVSRIKEVSVVFAATYQHRELFEALGPAQPAPVREEEARGSEMGDER